MCTPLKYNHSECRVNLLPYFGVYLGRSTAEKCQMQIHPPALVWCGGTHGFFVEGLTLFLISLFSNFI